MLGEHSGKRYRLGDRVRVQVVRVDMESTKIDFVLESVPGETAVEAGDVDGNRAGVWGDKPTKKPKKAHKRHG